MTINPSNISIAPTNPYHIARAYGVEAPAQLSRVGGAGGAAASVSQVPTVVAGNSGPASKLPSAAQKLVGARVAGKVDFSGDQPVQSTAGTLSFYKHPADKNAAATAVSVGRSLDVKG